MTNARRKAMKVKDLFRGWYNPRAAEAQLAALPSSILDEEATIESSYKWGILTAHNVSIQSPLDADIETPRLWGFKGNKSFTYTT